MKTVVVNTSPLLVLDRIDCLHLLPELFGNVLRPQSVINEIKAGHDKYGVSERILKSKWLKTIDDPPEMALRPELGAGETAAIALAVQRKADLILLDDLVARNVAVELGLNVSGTLGVLLVAKQKGLITDMDRILDDLNRTGFRMSESLVNSVKNKAE